jgi:orotate phosphoribosyltransferase-like protein
LTIPAEIDTLNGKAWYMYNFLGMTYEQIGRELHYSRETVPAIINNAFQRQTRANIYKKQVEYCKNDCEDSISYCRQCNLYKFMVKKMMKR